MRHLLRDTITIYPKSTKDRYGKDTWGTGVEYVGRFLLKNTRMLDAKGVEIQADATVYLPNKVDGEDVAVAIGYKVAFDSENYRAVFVYKPKDDSREEHHIKLLLKRLKE